ncbi:Uncharacterized protein APZ42_029702 [Daphnia magna]|uniref:Uncharacterized protein n=1 Tax=Daphnia magna TaxID=35525 RepID=A0A0P5Y0Y1_9CRUS|nr:Uncharacterized protein APZ42_029702 [Daphnia magna]
MDFEVSYMWYYVLNDIFAKPLIDVTLKNSMEGSSFMICYRPSMLCSNWICSLVRNLEMGSA